MANGVEVAKAYVTIIPSMSGAQGTITSAVTSSMGTAGKAGGAAAGAAATAGLASKLAKFAAPAAVAASFAVLGKQCADSFVAVEEGANNVIKATGATGEQAEDLIGVYKNVAQNVVGDFGDIGAAVGELQTRFGITGDALQTASEQTMQFAKVSGVDATTAVQAVSRMMNSAGIDASQYGETLDKLTVAAQQSGIDVTKLAETVTNNAASFSQLGFSTDESIAMLANFEKAGVNTSAVLSGMKKGVSEWAKEGMSAGEGFANFVAGVQDGSLSAADAIELFGGRAGTTMYEAAKNGQLDFQEMYDAIASGSDGALASVYEETLTLSDKMGLLKQNFMEAGASIAEPFVDGLSELADVALPIVQQFSDGVQWAMDVLGEAFAPVKDALGGLLDSIVETGGASSYFENLGAVFKTVASIIGSVLAPVIRILTPIIQTLFAVWTAALDAVSGKFGELAESVQANIMPVVQQLMDWLTPKLEALQQWFTDHMPQIQAVIETVVGAISTVIGGAVPVIIGIVSTAVGVISSVISGLSSVVGVVTSIFEGVKNAITHPIETARDVIRGIIDRIKGFFSFSVPTPHIPLPHFTVNPPGWSVGDLLKGKIPSLGINWYATGGIFNSPSVIGVGEAGPEAVLPLSRLGDMLDIEDRGGVTNVYNVNGINFANNERIYKAFTEIIDEMTRLGRL